MSSIDNVRLWVYNPFVKKSAQIGIISIIIASTGV